MKVSPKQKQFVIPKFDNLNISTSEVESIFKPYIKSELNSSEQSWKDLVASSKSFWRMRYIKRVLFGWTKLVGIRNQKNIESNYSEQWTNTTLEQNISNNNHVPCVWGERNFLARSYGIKRVHQLLLAKFIELKTPKNILEVGSGNGLNLFVLSSLFPSAEFSGCELTSGGVAVSKKVAMEQYLPKYIQEFSPIPPKDLSAHKRIDFKQGSAKELPYTAGQFDMVFTVLALEQMEEIRHQALSELARVSNRYVVMIEPYRDWNYAPLNRHKVIALDYFSAYISDLPEYGLKPIGCYENIPNKLGYFANMIIAEKIS